MRGVLPSVCSETDLSVPRPGGFPCMDVPQVIQQLMDFSVVLKIMSTHAHVLSELDGLDDHSFLLSQTD